MKISPGEIRDIERLQKYERIFHKPLKNEHFSTPATAELLAIFQRSGIQGKSAIIIANDLLTQFGGVKGIFDYLYLTMLDLKTETFKVIFLNSANQIIDDENLFEGTLNVSSVYPREIVKSAVHKNAASLIINCCILLSRGQKRFPLFYLLLSPPFPRSLRKVTI